MEETTKKPFSTPTKQSIFAIVVIVFKYIRILIRQLIPLIAIAYFGGERSKDYLFIFIIGASIFYMIWSIISYFMFYFFLENEELNIRKGILKKTNLNIPFNRIQTINFKQNLVHRIFRVVQLEIDTAGSSGSEFSFDALSQDKAEQLRTILLEGKGKNASVSSDPDITTEQLPQKKESILELAPLDLIKIGISENHLKSGGLILLTFFGLFEYIEDFGYEADEVIEQAFTDSIQAGLIAIMVMTALFIIISFTISLFRSLFNYFNLNLWREGNQYKLVSGLFTRKEKTAPLTKIQIIQWSSDPLKKLFGFFDVSIKQAASAEVAALKSMRIPGCYLDQVEYLKENWLGKKALVGLEKEGVSIHYLYRRLLYRLLFAAIMLSFSIYLGKPLYIGFFVFLVFYFFWTSILSYRKAGYALNDQVFALYKGMFGDEYAILPMYKIQNTSIKQTPYQKRKELANLQIYTASGSVKLPYIPLETARRLQDYFLYKVESSNRKWM